MRRREKELDKLAPWIGYMVMAFNELEERLRYYLVLEIAGQCQYGGENIVGYAITEGMSYHQTIELLKKVVKLKKPAGVVFLV